MDQPFESSSSHGQASTELKHTEMIYDQESTNTPKVHLNFEEFEHDPLDESNFYSIIEKDHY
jgi:hypothetical protein